MMSTKIANITGWGLLGSFALDGFVNMAKQQYVDRGLAVLDKDGNLIPKPAPVKPKEDYFTPPAVDPSTDTSSIPTYTPENFTLPMYEGGTLIDALNKSSAAAMSSAQSLNALANNSYYDWEHRQAQHAEEQANFKAYNEGIIVALAEIAAHLRTMSQKEISVNVQVEPTPLQNVNNFSPSVLVPETPVNVTNEVNVPQSTVNITNDVAVPETPVTVENTVNVPQTSVNITNEVEAEFKRTQSEIDLTELQLQNQQTLNELTTLQHQKTTFELTPRTFQNFEEMPSASPVELQALNNATTAMKHSHENLFEFDGADLDELFMGDLPDISEIFALDPKSARIAGNYSSTTGGGLKMSLQTIGQNGAEEFFETILYMTAYEEAKGVIQEYTGDIDNEVVQEALNGAMTVVTMGVVFQLIRTQEQFIEKIFNITKGLVTLLLASNFAQRIGSRLGQLKGVRLFKKLSIFKQAYSDRIATAQLVVNGASNQFAGERTAQAETGIFNSSMKVKDHVLKKEENNMNLGGKMASRYNETLLFKLFTRNFGTNDITLLKKILGSGASANLKADDLNKVADFMFVVGDDGEITGLTEQFFQLLNGMGYTHK